MLPLLAYTSRVRFLAILLIVVIGSFVVSDELACPDGCTNAIAEGVTSPTHDSQQQENECFLCHGAFALNDFPFELVPEPLVRQGVQAFACIPIFTLLARIEHPSRLA